MKAPSTLPELIAPFSVESFMALLRERKLTLLRGAGVGRYSALLNWPTLLKMIERGQHPTALNEFYLVKDSRFAPPDRWLKASPTGRGNVVDIPQFLSFMDYGFSLAFYGLDSYSPQLKALSEGIRSVIRERIKIGAIVTKGTGGAFTLHYDPEDLIILQAEGRKRWKIFGPPVVNPIVGVKQPAPPEDTLIFDEILEAGDFLFLPAGNWHRCENLSDRSLHLGIFFQPPNGVDLIRALTLQLLSEESFRKPLTRLDDGTSLIAVEEDIKNRTIERITKLDLSAFLSDFQGQ